MIYAKQCTSYFDFKIQSHAGMQHQSVRIRSTNWRFIHLPWIAAGFLLRDPSECLPLVFATRSGKTCTRYIGTLPRKACFTRDHNCLIHTNERKDRLSVLNEVGAILAHALAGQ